MRRLSFLASFFFCSALVPYALALECPLLVEAREPVETTEYAKGLLWRIDSAAGRSSYLFGTIHISDPRVTALPAPVAEAFAKSGEFGMEVLLDTAAITTLVQAMYFGDGRTLSGVVEKELFDGAVVLLAQYGVTPRAAAALKPWAAFTTLSLPPGQTAAPLDLRLQSAASDQAKKIFGLESIEEQVAVFEGLAQSDQAQLLAQTVCYYDEIQSDLEVMIRHYLARDLAGLMRMSTRYESPVQDRFMDVLLWQRNRRMADRMQPKLEKGDVFVAIGALHLPGKGGVLDLLAERGYNVERVY